MQRIRQAFNDLLSRKGMEVQSCGNSIPVMTCLPGLLAFVGFLVAYSSIQRILHPWPDKGTDFDINYKMTWA